MTPDVQPVDLPPFSLQSIAEPDRLAVLRSMLRSGPSPSELTVHHVDDLRAFNQTRTFGAVRMSIAGVSGLSARVSRGSECARGESHGALTMHVLLSGELVFAQAGRKVAVGCGDLVLTSTRHPLDIRLSSPARLLSFTIDESALGDQADDADGLLVSATGKATAHTPVVVSFLRALGAMRPSTPEVDGAMEAPTIELVRSFIATASGNSGERAALTAPGLGDQIESYLERRFSDPDLTPGRIAKAHGISVRYLYSTLANRGIALGPWIREHRVDEAARILVDPVRADLPISVVAQLVGFSDQAHFARAFRRVRQVTPTDWRRLHDVASTTLASVTA